MLRKRDGRRGQRRVDHIRRAWRRCRPCTYHYQQPTTRTDAQRCMSLSCPHRVIQRYHSQVGICERCKGTGIQECQLCYGVGSIARPGYINVADPALRRKCRRCAGFGRLPCGLCGAATQLPRAPPRPNAYPTPAVVMRSALPPPSPAGGTPPRPPGPVQPRRRRDVAHAEQYLQLDGSFMEESVTQPPPQQHVLPSDAPTQRS